MTNAFTPLQVSRFLQVSYDAAAQKGIELSVGLDFIISVSLAHGSLQQRNRHIQPSGQIARQLNQARDIGSWGVEKDNDVALLGTARLLDLSHSKFA